MRYSLRFVSCVALALVAVLLVPAFAQAGCFGGRGGLFGFGVFRGRAAQSYSQSCSQASFSGSYGGGYSATYQSQNFQSFQTPAPAYAPTYAAPRYAAPQAPQSCPGGVCPMTGRPLSAVTPQPSPGPSSFLAQLNDLRARHGLAPVAFDPALRADAAENNRQQRARGLGHFFMGRARRQNAAMGQASAQQALQDWMTSPGHMAALLDPTIRLAAVAGDGPAWTFAAR